MSVKPPVSPPLKSSVLGRVAAGVAILFAGLNVCKSAEPPSYVLYNATGQRIIAATIGDASGGQVATKREIDDGGSETLRADFRAKYGKTLTIQWLGGQGLARWYEATVPLKLEKAGGGLLHIYLRSDKSVCASLRADAAARAATAADNSASLACTMAVELPRLATAMASGLKQGSITRRPSIFSHGDSPVINATLTHKTGAVELFRKGEFFSALPLGNQSGYLVRAWIGGNAGMFVVTGDATGWKSRFLGRLQQLDGPLPAPRVMYMGDQGYRMVVDTTTADIFFFPGTPNRDYWILGQSTDGKHLAIAMPEQKTSSRDLDHAQFNLRVIDLQQGTILEGVVARMPPRSDEPSIEKFYEKWYKEHCAWTPSLRCK